MSFETQLYGLRLRSNCPLPGLTPASDVQPLDVQFDLCDAPPDSVPEVSEIDWCPQPVFETRRDSHHITWGSGRDGRYWRLWYGSNIRCRAVEFVIHPAGRRVWAFCHAWAPQSEPINTHDVTTLLLGSVMGMVLRMRGTLCLHASVVSVETQAVLILGNKGMGKSSIAAAMAQRGHPVLADDIAAITNRDGTYIANAGYPRLRLWPATVRALEMPDDGLKPVLRVLDKRYVELTEMEGQKLCRFHAQPLPIAAIYLLTRSTELHEVVIERLAAADRLATLIAQTSVRFMPLDEIRRAEEFAHLSRLATSVPSFRIQCPEGLNNLPAVCKGIEDTARSFAVSAA